MRFTAMAAVLLLLGAGCLSSSDPEPFGPTDVSATTAPSSSAPAPEPAPEPSEPETEPETEPEAKPEAAPPQDNETQEPQNETREPEPFEPEGTNKACNSLALVTPLSTDPAGLAAGWSLLELHVAMIADPYFVAAHPDDWKTLLEDLVLDANPHYEAQMGLRLVPLIIDALPPGTLSDTATPELIWDTARGFMRANHPDSAHDYVAVILGADYNGGTAGQVQCVHGAYDPDTAYLWSEYDQGREAPTGIGFFQDIPLKVFMHETAHLLAAHHHYTNCGEAAASFSPDDALALCGVMINDIGLASFQFSPTNRLIMRSFVEETGIGSPA